MISNDDEKALDKVQQSDLKKKKIHTQIETQIGIDGHFLNLFKKKFQSRHIIMLNIKTFLIKTHSSCPLSLQLLDT